MIINDLRSLIDRKSYYSSINTTRNRYSAVNKLSNFLLYKKYSTVDLKILVEFRDYLRKEEFLAKSTIYTYTVGILKPLLIELGIKNISEYTTDFKLSEETRQVCLDENQVYKYSNTKINRNDYESFSYSNSISYERFIMIKDLFLLQCISGVSISDLPKLFEKNIEKGKIYIFRQKTGNKAEIPITNMLLNIINKYSLDDIKFYKSNTIVNNSIRYICKLSGFTEEITYKYKDQIMKSPLYELIHSHTGRHTLINILLKRGVSVENIKEVTGHSSNQSITRVYSHLNSSEWNDYKIFNQYFHI